MTRHLNGGLAFIAWPAIDRQIWNEITSDDDPFDKGPFAKANPITRTGRMYAYGLWLGFLELFEPELLDLEPARRVQVDLVKDFADHLGDNCTETTVGLTLSRLYYVIRAFCPGDDWGWLYQASRAMLDAAVPVRHPPVMSDELYRVGLRAMERAEGMARKAGMLTMTAATRYRDGMLIATLVEAPMRRKPFSLIEIGQQLEKEGQCWVISIPKEMTKTKTAQTYRLSERLSGYMDVYLERIRPAFPGADSHIRLWPQIGRPMTDKMVRRRIIKLTEQGLGLPVPPHRFRNAAATFIAAEDPKNVRVARDLLGHRSFDMTEKHYIDPAQSRAAGRGLQAVLANHAEAGQ